MLLSGALFAKNLPVETSFKNRAIRFESSGSANSCCTLFLVVMLVIPLFVASDAFARLSGSASLTYTDYQGSARNTDDSGRNTMSSQSFVQNYSLMYASSDTIYNSRVGHYDVSLGYNWTALDTTFRSSTRNSSASPQADFFENFNETRGHLLYNGEISLDPKEVPFKFNAFSRDQTQNSVQNSNGTGRDNFGSIFGARDMATGIHDGIHIENGATLVAGVKNGMTNGYNEFLRHFPMILVDYKDVTNRDLRSMNNVDDRLSRLAFVSLNKKDNWFHYRHTEYNDYLNPLNNYFENQIQLGTVDQYMSRRWIDFANWIKVSTDLQFSKRKSNYQDNAIEDIDLNLFVTGERKYWNARAFTTFNRTKDDKNTLSYQTTLPLYVSGVVSQDISWNAKTSYRNNADIDAKGASSRFSNVVFGYRVDAFKRSPFTLSQSFDVESSSTKISDFITLSAGLETSSTNRFSNKVSLAASYNIKNTTTSSGADTKSDFLEQQINLISSYAPANNVILEVRQSNTFTKGNITLFSGTTRNSETQLNQYYSPRNLSAADTGSESYHSVSSFTASWNPAPRLTSHFTLKEDVYKTSASSINAFTEMLANVSFSNDAWSLADTLKYNKGSLENAVDSSTSSVSNDTSVKYTHSRNLDASASASYVANFSKDGDSRSTNYGQNLNYMYFTKTGAARKLFEINEVLAYSDGSGTLNQSYNKSLMLSVKYYPVRQLTLIAGVGYLYNTSFRDYTMTWNSSAVANFRLMQASLDYTRGIRKIDGAYESKFTGNIRRSF